MQTKPTFHPLGDQALLVSFGHEINLEINEAVYQLYATLLNDAEPCWTDLIPAYNSLTLLYDASTLFKKYGQSPYHFVKGYVATCLASLLPTETRSARSVDMPVCYHPEYGLDIVAYSKKCSISVRELIQLHTGIRYHVYMLGFLPGFAYMGTVDKRIAGPRLDKPRTAVPAGSVGIAANQTGIYPLQSPGGWNIIGRTPIQLFDISKEEPSYLQPGDSVRFYEISKSEFEEVSSLKSNKS